MPRKTRKQKEKIAQRKGVYSERSRTVKREFSFNLSELQNTSLKAKNTNYIDKSSPSIIPPFYARDLVKSVVMALIIFSLEFLLYWARSKSAL